MVLVICAIVLVATAGIWRLQRAALETQYRRAAALIDQHAAELSIRRRQCTIVQNYGLIDDSRWQKEIVIFVSHVLVPAIGPIDSKRGNLRAIYNLINASSADFQSAAIGYHERISPVEYEQLVAATLHNYGWETRTTKGSGDQGVDVIAEMRGVKVILQCKHYGQPVGNAAVQEAMAGMRFESGTHAAVVSNAPYTISAKQLAATANVFLLHHDELPGLEEKIFGTASAPRDKVERHTVAPPVYEISAAYVLVPVVAIAVCSIVYWTASSESSSDAANVTSGATTEPEAAAPPVKLANQASASIPKPKSQARFVQVDVQPARERPESGATSPPASPPAPEAPVDDLNEVRTADAAAAEQIDTYCAGATASAGPTRPEILARCRQNEVLAWRRVVVQKEFPFVTPSLLETCSQPPFPKSFVALEACERYKTAAH